MVEEHKNAGRGPARSSGPCPHLNPHTYIHSPHPFFFGSTNHMASEPKVRLRGAWSECEKLRQGWGQSSFQGQGTRGCYAESGIEGGPNQHAYKEHRGCNPQARDTCIWTVQPMPSDNPSHRLTAQAAWALWPPIPAGNPRGFLRHLPVSSLPMQTVTPVSTDTSQPPGPVYSLNPPPSLPAQRLAGLPRAEERPLSTSAPEIAA